MKFKNKKTGGVVDFSPCLIDSSLLSAQNRQRYYWCNWPVSQPDDKGIVLSDIIENGVVDRDKSYCLDANYAKGGNLTQYFNKSRRQLVFQVAHGCNKEGFKAINGETPTMTTSSREHNNFLASVEGYRMLTVTECERLQTFPDGFSEGVSNTQRYKMLGNGFTVDVISHILSQSPLGGEI